MKQLVFVLATIFTLVSCKSFRGNLNTTSELTLKDKKQTVKVPAGEHTLKVSFSSKRKGKFEIFGKKVAFKLKKGVKLPTEGEFCLKENQWDQNFEACGGIESDVTYGPLRHDWESCTYQIPRTICEGGGHNRRCYTVYDTYHGQRLVEYRMKNIVETLRLNVYDRGLEAGNFNAINRYNDKVYQHQGPCR
jgi:hypothetical protein